MKKMFDQEFLRFYSCLPSHHQVFYMFFSSHLLFWVNKVVELVPGDVNLVLISSGLDTEERNWIETTVSRPCLNYSQRLSDNDVLDTLLRMNTHNFGWIDIDCFILDPQIFTKLSAIDNTQAINCVWTSACKNRNDITLLNTYCMYFNIDVFKDVFQKTQIRAFPYAFEGTPKEHPDILYLTPKQAEMVSIYFREYPIQANPDFHSTNYFDSLIAYQLIGKNLGYNIGHVCRNTSLIYYTNEAIHIGAANLMNQLFWSKSAVSQSYKSRVTCIFMYLLILKMEREGRMPSFYYFMKKRFETLIPYRNIDSLIEEINMYMEPYDIKRCTIERIIL